MDYEESEIPKYIKRKKSSLSKSREKSKHKHKYVECLLINDEFGKPYKAAYCKICGKVGDVKFCETEKTDHGTYRKLSDGEVLKNTRIFHKFTLKIYIKSIFRLMRKMTNKRSGNFGELAESPKYIWCILDM